ncbi:MAG TPA: ABC transporter permease, partial [Gemmatimonadaceae bacterium]
MRFETIWQDVRYAARGLRQKPGFTVAVVLTLALGIGANAAMFGIVDRLLFRPPSYMKAPDLVHRVYLVRTFDGKETFGAWFQYTRYQDLTRWTTSFDTTAAVTENDAAVGVGDNAREMRISGVSGSYWSLFNAPPAIGRYFTQSEDSAPRGASVVVLSNAFWRSRYGSDPKVLGQQLKIAKVDYTIIGVAPDGFVGAAEGRAPIAWVPITTWAGTEFLWNPKDLSNWYTKYNISWMQMLARRKATVTMAAATADITNAYKRSYAHQIEISPNT